MDTAVPLGGFLILILASLMWIRTELGKKPSLKHLEEDYQRKDVCGETVKRMRTELDKKPSFKHLEEDYQRKDVCNETVKRIEEKLSYIPQMQETLQKIEVKLGKLEVLIKNNGRKQQER